VYFVGENDLPVNPDLMEEVEMESDTFITKKEVFAVPWNYNT